MKVIFSKYAKQELDDATQYYEIEYQGLGKRIRGIDRQKISKNDLPISAQSRNR